MKKIRALIIDDEPPAVQLLEKYVSMVDDMEVAGIASNGIKAADLLDKVEVDLVFLDIRMPVIDGLAFPKFCSKPPEAIITTAYREYAVAGYDLDIIDYLLKPITFERFEKAITRFRGKAMQQLSTPLQGLEADHLFVNVNRVNHKLLLRDIKFIESLKDYVRIHTNSEKLIVKGNIGSFMRRLPVSRFLRIHRSFAISLIAVDSFSPTMINIDGTVLPVGISYRKQVAGLLN